MKQQTLTGFEKYGKTTRSAQFLADMDKINPEAGANARFWQRSEFDRSKSAVHDRQHRGVTRLIAAAGP
jgi:hypothetical protein